MENYDPSEELRSPNYILYILLGIVLVLVGRIEESTITVHLGFVSFAAALVNLGRPTATHLVKKLWRRGKQWASHRKEVHKRKTSR